MKALFQSPAPSAGAPAPTRPSPVEYPELPQAHAAALYRGNRSGGDFFDFVTLPGGRVVFVLLDIAGKREQALAIAGSIQPGFRQKAEELFRTPSGNQAETLTDLLLHTNRAILDAAGGVRCAPAFLGCFESELGMLYYCNAGHTPALIKDATGITQLPAGGFPLGLFSHATHDAQMSVLAPGAALVMVSKGLVESRVGSREFGLERVIDVLNSQQFSGAAQICQTVIGHLEKFLEQVNRYGPLLSVPGLTFKRNQNDTTVVALVRGPKPE